MEDLDMALNELGMLSSVTKYKIDYLKAMETSAEIKRARSASMLETARDESDTVNISLNSKFVTNISLRKSSATDLSPYGKRKLHREMEEKRLKDSNSNPHIW